VKIRPVAGVARALAPTWVRRPDTPRRLVLAVTRRCNLRCGTCRTYDLDPGDELTPAEIGALMAGMPRLAWLDLTGGEPFLRGDIEAVFDEVLARTPALRVLHFPTSGWFADRAVACAERVRRARPDLELLVTVSVDGPPSLHDRMRGREGAFERAMEAFAALDAIEGTQVFVGTTVGPDNRDALDGLRDALREHLGPFDDRRWHWNLVQGSRHFFGNEGVGPQRGDAQLIHKHLRRRWPPRTPEDVMEAVFLLHKRSDVEGRLPRIPCHALHGGAFVAADGVLYPCHVYDRPLVDLRAARFDVAAAWRSDQVMAARRDVRRLACGGCFTPCEAYPTLAGAPLRTGLWTCVRAAQLLMGSA